MTFVAGHFGEWLQGLVGIDGPLVLVTLASPDTGVTARTVPDNALNITQDPPIIDTDRCRRFLSVLGLATNINIDLKIDLPPGGGAGMSTAALVALARDMGAKPDAIAKACLAVEGATDPLMLDAPDCVLWAPRLARTLEKLQPPPKTEIVGGFWGAPVQTDPGDACFPDVEDLVGQWRACKDLGSAAEIATESARRTTILRGPVEDPTEAIARELGALGYARAHTGSARALIFPPGSVPPGAKTALQRASYTQTLQFMTGQD